METTIEEHSGCYKSVLSEVLGEQGAFSFFLAPSSIPGPAPVQWDSVLSELCVSMAGGWVPCNRADQASEEGRS